MNAKSAVTDSAWVDQDDAPELTDAWFEQADMRKGAKLLHRGRPVSSSPKISTTLRFDAVILEAFKATGKGWQTRMNDALHEWLKEHHPVV